MNCANLCKLRLSLIVGKGRQSPKLGPTQAGKTSPSITGFDWSVLSKMGQAPKLVQALREQLGELHPKNNTLCTFSTKHVKGNESQLHQTTVHL